MIYRIILLVCIGLSLGACQKHTVKPSEYVALVRNEESGLSKKRQIGEYSYEVTYCPTAFMVANELRRNDITQAEYDTLSKKYEDSHYVILKIGLIGADAKTNIENYGVSSNQQLEQRLYYLSFAMQNDLHLVNGADTLSPALFHYERSYDLAPHRTFMVIFPKRKQNTNNSDMTFILASSQLGTGIVKFTFEHEKLNALPNLLTK